MAAYKWGGLRRALYDNTMSCLKSQIPNGRLTEITGHNIRNIIQSSWKQTKAATLKSSHVTRLFLIIANYQKPKQKSFNIQDRN